MIKHSFSKLIWLMDAHQIIADKNDSFWLKLSLLSAEYQQERPVGYVLYLLEKIFGDKIPSRTVFSNKIRYLTMIEKRILNMRVNGASMGDFGNVLWMLCLPGFKECLRYAVETLFPKRFCSLKKDGFLFPVRFDLIFKNS